MAVRTRDDLARVMAPKMGMTHQDSERYLKELVAEMTGTEDPSVLRLDLQHVESHQRHASLRVVEQVAAKVFTLLSGGQAEEVVVDHALFPGGQAFGQISAQSPEILLDDVHEGFDPLVVLRGDPSCHLASDADGQQHQRSDDQQG